MNPLDPTPDPPPFIAFDLETYLIEPGILAPRIVCGSFSREGDSSLYLREEALDLIEQVLTDPELEYVHLGGANILYDLGCAAAARPRLVPAIFSAVGCGRILDTHILEVLHDIARGMAYKDGAKEFKRYSLNLLEKRYLDLDRSEEKHSEEGAPQPWRLRYGELDGVPLSEWPPEASKYPIDDAVGARRVLERQLVREVRVPQEHDWSFGGGCMHCDAPEGTALPCPDFVVKRHNLDCFQGEIRAAWWLHLSAIWGIRTDPEMVPVVVAEWQALHEQNRREFFASGIVRVKVCGKDEDPDDIGAEWLTAQEEALQTQSAEWVTRRRSDVAACLRGLAKGKAIRFAVDTKRLKDLVEGAYQGAPPLTEGGATSTARDTLEESGDELLEAYGEAGPVEKERSTFAKALLQGTTRPINPSISYVKVTQRCSYSDPGLQQLPRKGRTRECFVPRAGWVFGSLDYGGVELCTLGQCCLWLFGHSSIADAINAGQDLHTRLGARVLGVTYEEAIARKKARDPVVLDIRQSMKPINFGKPGLMGPPKMVLTARKDGVKFCELAGRGPCRGHARTIEWRGRGHVARAIPPTCVEALELAAAYSDLWYEEWGEMREYHRFTTAVAEAGEPLESLGPGGLLRLEDSPNAVSNHYFQRLAAVGMKHAGWLLSKEAYCDSRSVLYNNFRIVLGVHDEVLYEVREEVATECSWRATEILKAGMAEVVPDVAISIEPALMRRWFKGAEKVEVEVNGRKELRPWWPETPCRKCQGKTEAEACSCWTWPADQERLVIDTRKG